MAILVSKVKNENYLYLPSKIYQFRKYPNFAKLLSIVNSKYKVTFTNNDFVFSKETIQQAIRGNLKVTEDKNLNWVLNSGNFIVNRKKSLKVMENLVSNDVRSTPSYT